VLARFDRPRGLRASANYAPRPRSGRPGTGPRRSCRNPRARAVLSRCTRCNACKALDTNVHVRFRQSPLAGPVSDGASRGLGASANRVPPCQTERSRWLGASEIARRRTRWSGQVSWERRKSRLCRGEEERAEAFCLRRATSTKRASEASTSPSGELWDELGRSKAAMREQQAQTK
jgi:hypothetical protein